MISRIFSFLPSPTPRLLRLLGNSGIASTLTAAGTLPTTTTTMSTSTSDVTKDNSDVVASMEKDTAGDSAAKRARVVAGTEDTSSYIGPKRSKVRGNIRGADKYKGRRDDAWGPVTRNAEAASSATGVEGTESATTTTGDDGQEREARLPKRKVALLMAYCGTGYQGMQVYVD